MQIHIRLELALCRGILQVERNRWKEQKNYLNTIVLGYPQQSVIYYGLRGVGKTVLLNAIECKTDDMPVLMGHIEIAENEEF